MAVVLFSPAGHALASENIIRAEGVYMLQEYPEDVFFQQLTRSDEHCLGEPLSFCGARACQLTDVRVFSV